MTLHLKKRMDQLELKLRENLDDSLQSIESRVSQDFQAQLAAMRPCERNGKRYGLYQLYLVDHP